MKQASIITCALIAAAAFWQLASPPRHPRAARHPERHESRRDDPADSRESAPSRDPFPAAMSARGRKTAATENAEALHHPLSEQRIALSIKHNRPEGSAPRAFRKAPSIASARESSTPRPSGGLIAGAPAETSHGTATVRVPDKGRTSGQAPDATPRIPFPAVWVDLGDESSLAPEQLLELQRSAEELRERIADSGLDPASPEYRSIWENAVQDSDQAFRQRYGGQAWHQHHVQTYHMHAGQASPPP